MLCIVFTFQNITLILSVLVTVLSTYAHEEHKEVFGSFVKNELQLDLKWVYSKSELKRKSKYVLLCKLESRLPEDVECILKHLGIKSKIGG